VRRASALGLGVASCAALVGAWRLGQQPHSGLPQGLARPVSPAPSTSSPGTAAPKTPAPTKSSHASTSPASTATRSFTGAAEGTQFGTVQVQAVLRGNRLVDVVPIHLTDSSGRSVSISAQAAPILRREALAAGSAQIDAVSGASYTSAGYVQSLQSALDAARAAGA
jgi:uncharacterized protein with FMN-binding domain